MRHADRQKGGQFSINCIQRKIRQCQFCTYSQYLILMNNLNLENSTPSNAPENNDISYCCVLNSIAFILRDQKNSSNLFISIF